MRVVPRAEWAPKHGRGNATPGPQSRVVIHHAPERRLPDAPTRAQIAAQLRVIEDWHAATLTPTNPRIGYHFVVVEQTGDVWEGLGWGRIGAHVAGNNTASLGVLVLGIDGGKSAGSARTWRAIAGLVQEGIRRGHLTARPELAPHREYVATTCPGDRLARYVEVLTLDALLGTLDVAIPPPPADVPEPAIPAPWLPPTEIITPPPPPVGEIRPPLPAPTPERPPLAPLHVPERPADVTRTVPALRWAREAAREIAAAAPTAALLDGALATLRERLAGAVPAWLLALLWPLVEREARRLAGSG